MSISSAGGRCSRQAGFPAALLRYPLLEEIGQADLQRRVDHLGLERLLHPEEIETCRCFPAEQRRNDWLLGRTAAKMLVRRFLFTRYGLSLSYSDILLRNTDPGVPYFLLPGCPDGEALAGRFNLSLAHSHGRGLAGLAETDTDGRIGVDLEHITRRSPGLAERVLTPKERQYRDFLPHQARDAFFILCWSLKEAALKALQIGIRVSFQDIELEVPLAAPLRAAAGQAAIRLQGSALRVFDELGGTNIRARYALSGGFAYALVRIGQRIPI